MGVRTRLFLFGLFWLHCGSDALVAMKPRRPQPNTSGAGLLPGEASQTTTHRPGGGAPTKYRASPAWAKTGMSLWERRPRRDEALQTTTHRPGGGAPTKCNVNRGQIHYCPEIFLALRLTP
jgi:hypothetical protein